MIRKRNALTHSRTHALLFTLLLAASPALAQLPPDATWRTFETDNFTVTYIDGLEPIARRAADRAERAYDELSETLLAPPEGSIALVIADNVDYSNGFATPFPRNRIVIYTNPPVDEPELAFYDEWMEVVITHELTHIFHLDHAEGIWDPLRSIFGRNPALFPEIVMPGWTTEGLATYYESRLTRAGRVRGTYQDMILRTAILDSTFFSIDRASGSPVHWPAGATRYIYGSLFIQHLAETHGPDAVVQFIDDYGGQLIPFRLNNAADDAFGVSLGEAWRTWEDSLRARYSALADSLSGLGLTRPEILTTGGRYAQFPRFSPGGDTIAYVGDTGHEVPSTRLILPGREIETLEARTSAGPTEWTPDGSALIYAELNFVDPYRIYSDVYRLGLGDGDDENLTEAARIWEVDLHPDGGAMIGVGNADGTNVLKLVDLASSETRTLVAPSLDVHWSVPRWSPDGARIAAARWRTGGFFDVVILDASGEIITEVTDDRAVDRDPTWSPDGRYLIFSSDRTGIANLYAYEIATGRLRQVTNVLTGAFQPDISPDGERIAFSYLASDGYHIASIPFDASSWTAAPPVRDAVVTREMETNAYTATAGGEDREYSAWPSILPTHWSVLGEYGDDLGPALGAMVTGRDVVERHLWGADLSVFFDGLKLDAGAAYQYRGLGLPVVELEATQRWRVEAADGALMLEDSTIIETALFQRTQRADISLSWTRPQWRSISWLTLGSELLQRELVWDEPEAVEAFDLTLRDYPVDAAASLEAGYSSAQSFPFSIGPQSGVLLSARVEGHRYLEPFAGEEDASGFVRTVAHGRTFAGFDMIGFAPHVFALRLDAGVDEGSRSPGFSIGGSDGGSLAAVTGLDLFDASVAFPLRGYDEGVQRGTRAVSATAEYRFPLALVERGIGVLPIFLDRVWADVFADAATAWDPAPREILSSVGAEIIAELDIGYHAPLDLRAGVAVPLQFGDPVAFIRLGRSF